MSNSQILYKFNELNDKEKLIYSSGFKTAYLMNKNNIKTSSNKINEILNYKIPKNVLETEIISKNNKILKNKNKELLNKFEEIIKICPENFKDQLVSSLKEYLFYDKKYNESLELFKKLRQNIKENKNNDVWINQMKYIKIINSYKNMLEKSHDKLYKNISNIKLTNTINPFILKKDNQDNNDNLESNEIVQESNEKVQDSNKKVQESNEKVQESNEIEDVKKEKKVKKSRKKKEKEEPNEQVQEEPTEQVQEEPTEQVQEETIKVKKEKKTRKPRKKKEKTEKKEKKPRKPRKKKETTVEG